MCVSALGTFASTKDLILSDQYIFIDTLNNYVEMKTNWFIVDVKLYSVMSNVRLGYTNLNLNVY
jgi:hypothetical protein